MSDSETGGVSFLEKYQHIEQTDAVRPPRNSNENGRSLTQEMGIGGKIPYALQDPPCFKGKGMPCVYG